MENHIKDLGIKQTGRKRLVIIGGGFAGLHLAADLQNSRYQIVLLDRENHHTFQHLLYQIAASALEIDSIAYPLRKLLKKHDDFHFRMAVVQAIEAEKNLVITSAGYLRYDYLVIATGAVTNYFGMESIALHALPMKTIAEALEIRNQVLKNFEMALFTTSKEERRKLTTIIIAGGGPAGVETAGAFAEFKQHVMPRDYPDLDPQLCKIYLIELLPRLMAQMSEKVSEDTEEYLRNMGVEVITETRIHNYDGEVVETDKGIFLTKILLWTGGISGAFIEGLGEDAVNRKGRIAADEFARVKGHENIFALGDVACMATEQFPQGHPQLAAVAVQQGRWLARSFLRLEAGKQVEPFYYKDRGMMANIGRKKGVIELPGGRTFKGFLPWFIWLAVHLFSLAGFQNKVITFFSWSWFYISRDMATRVIIEKRDE